MTQILVSYKIYIYIHVKSLYKVPLADISEFGLHNTMLCSAMGKN